MSNDPKGDVLELKEKIIDMTSEISNINSEVEQMKDNTLISSQLDPLKIEEIIMESIETDPLALQIDASTLKQEFIKSETII